MIIWTPTVLNVLYSCVLYFRICTCSVQLSMFHMERCSRNTLIIIIIIIIIIRSIIILLLLLLKIHGEDRIRSRQLVLTFISHAARQHFLFSFLRTCLQQAQ